MFIFGEQGDIISGALKIDIGHGALVSVSVDVFELNMTAETQRHEFRSFQRAMYPDRVPDRFHALKTSPRNLRSSRLHA